MKEDRKLFNMQKKISTIQKSFEQLLNKKKSGLCLILLSNYFFIK